MSLRLGPVHLLLYEFVCGPWRYDAPGQVISGVS